MSCATPFLTESHPGIQTAVRLRERQEDHPALGLAEEGEVPSREAVAAGQGEHLRKALVVEVAAALLVRLWALVVVAEGLVADPQVSGWKSQA